MIDIGVNLTSGSFNTDRDEVVARAREARINTLVLIGSNLRDSEDAVAMAHKYTNCVATAGVHPHHAKEWDHESKDRLLTLATSPLVRAIGETGLDFNRNYSPQEAQIKAFETQLEIAATTGLPAYIHQRDAHDTLMPILREHRPGLTGAVLHCFTGNEVELEDYLSLDLHIGITGWICDERRGYHLHDLIKKIPGDRLMVETDAPYLLPRDVETGVKNRRNEPAYLVHVIRRIAECSGKTEKQVVDATTRTAINFFNLSESESR